MQLKALDAAALGRVRIVLVETSHPGNIGATARAMKTMGLTQLVLVNPVCFPHQQATARAAGADDILHSARICNDLQEALTDTHRIYGASRRGRSLSWPTLSPRACAQHSAHYLSRADVAVLFGRERNGLSNEELELCHAMVEIESNPEYGSLNLAAAVQILAYEFRLLLNTELIEEILPLSASYQELERFYAHLEQAMHDFGFYNPAKPRRLMRRLRRLVARAHPTPTEVQILRGLLTAVQEHRKQL